MYYLYDVLVDAHFFQKLKIFAQKNYSFIMYNHPELKPPSGADIIFQFVSVLEEAKTRSEERYNTQL